jgi:hypothetical protein
MKECEGETIDDGVSEISLAVWWNPRESPLSISDELSHKKLAAFCFSL